MASNPELKAQEGARDRLYEEIAAKAKDAAPADLKTLAEAYAQISYGAQGGQLRRTEEVHYHYIAHQGEDKPKPKAGFDG